MSVHSSDDRAIVEDRSASTGRVTPVDLAVIGGGLSGLTLASQWAREHPQGSLQLIESANRTGGVIHTERVDDYLIDHGADMFAVQPPAALEFCRQLNADSQLLLPRTDRRGAMIVHRGKLQPIPEGFVLMRATQNRSMLTTPLLSPMEKVRFFRERFIASRTSDEDESVASFVRRRMGTGVLDRLVAPLVAGIYTADIERLSMRATMAPIWAMEKQYGSLAAAARQRQQTGEDGAERHSAGARYGNFRGFAGGMIELIETIERSLDPQVVRTGVTAQRILPIDGGWEIECQPSPPSSIASPSADPPRPPIVRAKRVVVATPASVTAKLIEPIEPVAASELAAIESASAAIVVLAVRRDQVAHPISMFGFVVPPTEGRQILAVSFASHKFDGRCPNDHVLIRVFIGGVLQKDLLDRDDAELATIARGELASLIGLSGDPSLTRVVRWNHAMPQYNVGHLDRVDRIKSAMAAHTGLEVLGNWRGGVGIAPVIRSAVAMAQSI